MSPKLNQNCYGFTTRCRKVYFCFVGCRKPKKVGNHCSILLKWNKNQSMKDPTKLEVTNHGRKSIWKHRNILKSLRSFCTVMLQHQGLLHIIAFKVCICIMDCAFTKPSIVRPHFLPTPSPLSIQSFSTGQNNNITTEVRKNIILQNCN